MRDDCGRLQDILDAIKRVERYAKRGRRVFEEDELVHTWMIHHIQIIGEAASQLCISQDPPASSLATDHQKATCVGS
jgi:uncharacterized protein with HEPN domain